MVVEQGFNINAAGNPPQAANCVILGTEQFAFPANANMNPVKKAQDADEANYSGSSSSSTVRATGTSMPLCMPRKRTWPTSRARTTSISTGLPSSAPWSSKSKSISTTTWLWPTSRSLPADLTIGGSSTGRRSLATRRLILSTNLKRPGIPRAPFFACRTPPAVNSRGLCSCEGCRLPV